MGKVCENKSRFLCEIFLDRWRKMLYNEDILLKYALMRNKITVTKQDRIFRIKAKRRDEHEVY